jgi:hypothetical protein
MEILARIMTLNWSTSDGRVTKSYPDKWRMNGTEFISLQIGPTTEFSRHYEAEACLNVI